VGSDETRDSDVDLSGLSDQINTWGETVERHVNAGIIYQSPKPIANVYPNPVSTDRITMETYVHKNDIPVEYRISTTMGTIVKDWHSPATYKTGLYDINIDLTGIDSGHYTLTVKTGIKSETHKLVVIK